METMKAVRIHAYGGSDQLVFEDVPRPEPKKGEVLVRVLAAGLNPVDWKIREGAFKSEGETLPLILGMDFSGVVEKLGPGTNGRFEVGDAVFGSADYEHQGSYAEWISLPANEVALKPRALDPIAAASVPMGALTAWQAAIEAGEVGPGMRVLIHGASGGLGSFAVQFCKRSGAYVIAHASAEAGKFLSRVHADELIDYHTEKFEEKANDVDLVLDFVGGKIQARSLAVLKPDGRFVTTVPPLNPQVARILGARAKLVFMRRDAGQLACIAEMIDEGAIRTHMSRIFPLTEARQAQDLSQNGHPHGKIVLKVA